ncbi:type II secretion system protein [Bythopirellula polymerisocia]|uniref:Putative major pilin subunit n=1 Tax=Bythopirellula polymerisocia TaxID=2528003 RepID=A0A5C6CWW3_9BACT|nr:type II secretion system protein [Bythopirellula polymerisocia]TWU29463.1 putative major pilin subunit [Bythopirellula polymerisocia]
MSHQKNAFTLIELVVVILILGILAGVGAPKLFSTSGVATENGLRQTLSVVRDGIELYSADNAGSFPTCTGDGTGAGNFHDLMKTYIRGDFPTCPVGTKDNLIKVSAVDPVVADDTTGWMYNPTTGEFICNSTSATPTNGAVTYDAL